MATRTQASAAVDDQTEPQITLPDPPEQPLLLTVRVDVDEVKPPVWRRLELRGDQSAADLHEVLQSALGWTDSHLHRFWVGPTKNPWRGPFLYTDLDEEGADDPRAVAHEKDIRVDQLLRATGDQLVYTYDFGDDWQHTIAVEQVRPATAEDPHATCIDGRNAGPLEDVGGPWSHNELVAAHRAGTGYPEPYDTWLPPGWDPSAFDRDETNLALSLLNTPGEAFADTPRHPAVDELTSRVHRSYARELTSLFTAALTGSDVPSMPPTAHTAPRSVSDVEAAEVTWAWRTMLDIAGSDGIPLTAAGYMRPALVTEVGHALGIDQWWFGKVNREDLTPPIRIASELIRSLGLLRKHKGYLVPTPLARRAAGSAQALFAAVASGALDGVRPRAGRPQFDSDARALVLAAVAAGRPIDEAQDAILRVLNAAGWRTDGERGVSPVALTHVVWDVQHILGQRPFGDVRDETPFTDAQRALARRALFPLP